MMIPYGYKQTEVGVIPEDWSVDTIGAVTLSVTNGGNYKNSAQISLYPLIKMGNISRGYINLKKIEYVIGFPPSENDRLTYGDVLLNTRNTPELVGKVAIWKNELSRAYFNSNLLRFNFKLEKSNPFFMNLLFNTEQVISEFRNIAKGTTSVAAIYPQDMLKVKIIIPPLQEQQRIAEALSDVDGMISSLEKLIAKYKSIKTTCLQQMFPQNGETVPRMRLPGFTGAWEQRKYGEVVETRRGLTYKPSDICDSGIRVLRSSNIDEDTFVLKADDVFVKKDAVNIDYSKENDILITSANGSSRLVGKHAIISSISGNPAVHGGFMLLGTTKEPYFINASMGSSWYRRFIELYVAGGNGAIGNLNKNDLDNQVILIPSEPEQRAIGAFFKQLDHLITLHQRKLEKIQKIKQGMMQQLLTGKIRLV